MASRHHLPLESLRYCSAPMVHQSDLPFRLLTVRHGATSTWTQMFLASDLNSNKDVLEALLKSLEMGRNSDDNKIWDTSSGQLGHPAPQVVQLAGNDVNELVSAARKVAHLADAVDLNLGCPQHHAEVGGYGAYLLPKQHWPKVTTMVSALAQAVDLPITTKIRLTVPKEQTTDLAVQLSLAGSSLITVHPRFASSARRRKGEADLSMVRRVSDALNRQGLLRTKQSPQGDTAVVSNGNVSYGVISIFDQNMARTRASGLMVAVPLLENPAAFCIPIGVTHSHSRNELVREYLDLRQEYNNALDSPLATAKQHLNHMLAPQKALFCPTGIHHEKKPEAWHRYRGFVLSKIAEINSEADLLTFGKTYGGDQTTCFLRAT